MPTKVKVSCPTCNIDIQDKENSPKHNYQNFDIMINLFGVTRSGKPNAQCHNCFDKGKTYERDQIERAIEINCMLCNKIVYNLIDAKEHFGFVKNEIRARQSCRTCRTIGNSNDSINDIKDGTYIDDYENKRRGSTPIVVTGNIEAYDKEFTEIGGFYYKTLEDRGGGGWVFARKRRGAVISFLQKNKTHYENKQIRKNGCGKCDSKQNDYGLYLICIKCGHLEHKNLK